MRRRSCEPNHRGRLQNEQRHRDVLLQRRGLLQRLGAVARRVEVDCDLGGRLNIAE